MIEQKVKFLIIRLSSIGDIVLTTPVIRCLKQQVENAEVHYLTKPEYESIIKNNPYIDKIHLANKSYSGFIKKLKAENFDYIIDLHHNFRTLKIKLSLKRTAFSFHKLNIKKWILVNFKINKLPTIHIVDRYLATLSVFDVKNDDKGLDYFLQEDEKIKKSTLPAAFQNGYIALVIGAKHETKKLPENKLKELVEKIHKPIIILGGKDDFVNGEKIAQHAATVHNVCGKYTLNQSASIIEQADFVITHDTGLMHIAAAFKKKIVSVWGNTIPEFGMYPYLPSNFKFNSASWIFEAQGLNCRPCSKIGFKKCPKGHFKCMQNIDVNKIVEIVN